MNVALHLLKLGFQVRFAGKVGNDPDGEALYHFLINHGLDTSLLQIEHNLPTSTVAVPLGPENRVTSEKADNVVCDWIEYTDNICEAVIESDVIVYGTLAAARYEFTRKTILKALKDAKGIKLIDVNLRAPYNTKEVLEPLLALSDIAKLNDDELRLIGKWYDRNEDDRELIKWLSEKINCEFVCVTRGANGAIVYHNHKFFEHKGFLVLWLSCLCLSGARKQGGNH